jgi:hypothetical protein
MANLKRTSNTLRKACFSRYASENRAAKNKLARLKRHVAKMPEDDQAAARLEALMGTETYKHKTAPKGSLYPIVTIRTIKGKPGKDGEEGKTRVEVTKLSREDAQRLRRGKAAVNAATYNENHYMTPAQLALHNQKKLNGHSYVTAKSATRAYAQQWLKQAA